jgi:tol-pal system protein YbgF
MRDLMARLACIFSGAILCAGMVLPAAAAERKAPVTEPASTNLEQRVNNLERQMQSQGLLDMLQQLQALKAEINNLRGQLEVNTHELEQLKERQRSLYNDLDGRLKKLEGKSVSQSPAPTDTAPPLEVMTPRTPTEPAGTQAESSLTVENVTPEGPAPEIATPENVTATENATQGQAPSVAVDPLEAQAEYQQAFNLLKQSQYDKAIAAFNAFLGKYPQSQYSENAQYWTGEAYFVTRRFNEAITEYMKLLTNYPQSQKAPNSLLKIGYSYYELKQDTEAKKVLQDLVGRYPGTPAAQDAAKRLQR